MLRLMHTAVRSRCLHTSAVSLALLGGLVASANATRISAGVAVRPEPFWHSSYVRNGAQKAIAYKDFDYDDAIHKYMGGDPMQDQKWDSVDVVFQTCYGGGFLNEIAALPVPHTFSSSAGWWESSYTDVQPPAGMLPFGVDNFTRAIRTAAEGPILAMIRYFREAALGVNPANLKDPFAPMSAFASTEHPQYSSPDIAIGGPNDRRGLGGIDQYAILVSWDKTEGRHTVNMARMRQALLAQGVLPGNIIELWGVTPPLGAPDLTAGPWGGVLPTDIAGLPGITAEGGADTFEFDIALSGAAFMFPPTGTEKLFIYNTGHGGQAISIQLLGIYIPIPSPGGTGGAGGSGKGYRVPIGGHTQSPGENWRDSVMDSSGNNLMQFTFDGVPGPGITLEINGVNFGSLDQYAATSEDVYPLEPYVSGSQVHFQVQVPYDVLSCEAAINPVCDGETADVRFMGMIPEDETNPRLLSVLTRGGDQETMAVIEGHELVPTPCYADADGDRDVDFDDLNIVMLHWGESVAEGDVTYDGSVDFLDLDLVLQHWGTNCD